MIKAFTDGIRAILEGFRRIFGLDDEIYKDQVSEMYDMLKYNRSYKDSIWKHKGKYKDNWKWKLWLY